MYLLEHDAKEILAQDRIPVPAGCLATSGAELRDGVLPSGPWMVKGQIAAGGRGKAGIIRKAATVAELHAQISAITGSTVNGRRVEAVRIEQQISGADEAYVSLMLDAAAGGGRVIGSERGGLEGGAP